MKIKKFPQSCVLVETNDKKILIDPSEVKFDESFLDNWVSADAVLVTHRHSDHINVSVLSNFKVPIFSSSEVKRYYESLNIKVIKQGDKLKVGNVNIEVVKAIHGYIGAGGEVLEGIGFIIDDGKTRLYITSDTIRYNGIEQNKCDVIMVNITAFDASMNLWGASQTFKDVGASLLIVAHQDTGRMIYEKTQIETYLSGQSINYIFPTTNEEFEI